MVFDKDKARRMIDATMGRNAELAGQLEQANNDLTRMRAELEEAKGSCEANAYLYQEATAKLAAAEAERDEAHSILATTADRANTALRELGMTEMIGSPTHSMAIRDAVVNIYDRAAQYRVERDEARRERDEARALIPIVCCNGADLNCYGPRGCLVRAQEANVTEKDVLLREREDHKARADRFEAAIRWALGEFGEFPLRQDGEGAYWWRKQLRSMAFLASPGASGGEPAPRPDMGFEVRQMGSAKTVVVKEAEQARGGETKPDLTRDYCRKCDEYTGGLCASCSDEAEQARGGECEVAICPECGGTGWFSPTPMKADGWPCRVCSSPSEGGAR